MELEVGRHTRTGTQDSGIVRMLPNFRLRETEIGTHIVKIATEVGVRAIQDHKVIEWNTCWKCRLSEGTDDK